MILSPTAGKPPSLMLIEGSLAAIAIAAAFCWPRLGSTYFSKIEFYFDRLARRQELAVAVVGLTAVLLRLTLLPLNPIPHPFLQDDFSFLLAADTFASGRLTNPTPAMWTHFESFHITLKPTYMSMYFPAQGLAMAAGKVLAGNPWFGILCVTMFMCAAICWMLQSWLPPTWALLGGMLAVLRLGLFSYWINTYTGAGSIAAIGGALVLGAFPRLMKNASFREALVLGIGIVLLALSRPYEGMLLCLPVAFVMCRWILFGRNRPGVATLLRFAAVPLLLTVAVGAWMAYYDYRLFGDPLTTPYKINRATYAVVPYWVWQSPRPEPAYRHLVMRDFYVNVELPQLTDLHTVGGFLFVTLRKAGNVAMFFAGIALLPPLVMLRRVLLDRRTRFLIICMVVLCIGMLMEIFLLPHYLAPFTAIFYALGLQAMRHLRVWRPGEQLVGIQMVRLIVSTCLVLVTLRIFAQQLHLRLDDYPSLTWYGSSDLGGPRARVQEQLERLPGTQLAIVRYSPSHNPYQEWVYNAADINDSKVIWAREMDDVDNLELIRYYMNRKVWLVQPDVKSVLITPYTLPAQRGANSR